MRSWKRRAASIFIVIYNSGRYRMAGRGILAGLMPYGDANAIVMEMAGEVLTVVKHTPVLAGVCGTDPFRQMTHFLREVKDIGFAGVQNFPTVGLIDGVFRQNLEETGMSYDLEVKMITIAHQYELLTTPYCFTPKDAEKMAEAGADIIVAHMGLTTKGSIGATTALTMDDCVNRVQAIADAAYGVIAGARAVPWRTNRVAGRRRVCAGAHKARAWVLRRIKHGTIARGNCDTGSREAVQGNSARVIPAINR